MNATVFTLLQASFFAVVLASRSSSSSSESRSHSRETDHDDHYDLKQVHLIFRHGDRTPDFPTYPNDPHGDFKYPPYGLGQLTLPGYNRIFNNGKYMRERYHRYLGSLYNQTEVHAQSTAYPRSIMGIQLFMNGLFPSRDTKLEWNHKFNFQPVVFTSQPLNNDLLLFPLGLDCPRLRPEWIKNYASVLAREKEFFDDLAVKSGTTVKSPIDIIVFYYALKSQIEYGLSLPSWTKKYYPVKFRDLSNEAWGYIVYNAPLKRIMGGTLLKNMIADWEARIAKKSAKKIFVYSAHDLTVVGILSACNLWDPRQSPNYGITAIFELKKHRKTGVYGVQVFVRNASVDKPVLLKIPGCRAFCPLADLKRILADNLPTATDCNAV